MTQVAALKPTCDAEQAEAITELQLQVALTVRYCQEKHIASIIELPMSVSLERGGTNATIYL